MSRFTEVTVFKHHRFCGDACQDVKNFGNLKRSLTQTNSVSEQRQLVAAVARTRAPDLKVYNLGCTVWT